VAILGLFGFVLGVLRRRVPATSRPLVVWCIFIHSTLCTTIIVVLFADRDSVSHDDNTCSVCIVMYASVSTQ